MTSAENSVSELPNLKIFSGRIRLDFSQPWQLSDVVLVVEGERFNVHRNILGMWSEVFATMFTTQFKEKTAEEVPLPGKKSSEMKEMLLVIYPTSAKPIDTENYAFLLDLAKEYMMAKITEKCEAFLMYGDEKRQTLGNCLELLDIAQNYQGDPTAIFGKISVQKTI